MERQKGLTASVRHEAARHAVRGERILRAGKYSCTKSSAHGTATGA
jgi:hypothetical protein